MTKEHILSEIKRTSTANGGVPLGRNRFRVESELRLAARQDSKLLSSRAFFNRYGSKRALVERVYKLFAGRQEHQRVISLCEAYLSTNPREDNGSSSDTNRVGYVYLLKMGSSYKIGKTYNPIRREGQIILQLPEDSSDVRAFKKWRQIS